MSELQPRTDDYIEPPGQGFVAPQQTPAANGMGLAPQPARPTQPQPQPPDELIPSRGNAAMPMARVAYNPSDPFGGMDPNVWAAKHQFPITRDASGNLVPDYLAYNEDRKRKGLPPVRDPGGAGQSKAAIQNAVAQEWKNAGYSDAAVDGIMRRVGVESGFNPHSVGDGDTSFGLYQHHADRAVRMAQWTKEHGLNPADPIAQTKFAIAEMNGLDPKAARHRDELMRATDPNAAYGIFTSSFERPAGAPGSEETNLRATALGGFNSGASAILSRWQEGMSKRSEEYDRAIERGKDLHSVAADALKRWQLESDKPPQNMHEAWSQWSGIASAFALLGGLFGHNWTASLSAAGGMLHAANQADADNYDRSYKMWKDHLDRGLKLVELLNTEARNVIDDAKKSYDEKMAELNVISTVHSLNEKLDPQSVENMTKSLALARTQREVIEAQNTDTEVRNAVREKDEEWLKSPQGQAAGGTVPANIHAQHVGEVKREMSGAIGRVGQGQQIEIIDKSGKRVRQGLAYTDSNGSLRFQGTGELVQDSVPDGGSINKMSTAQPRSAPAMYIAKLEQENPSLTAEEIAKAAGNYRHFQSVESALGGGVMGRNLVALNTVADHILRVKEYADALHNGQIPRANQIANAVSKEMGKAEVTTFEAGRDIMADEVVRLLTSTGGTEADRAGMQGRLSLMMSPDQFSGVFGVLIDMTGARFKAIEQFYAENDPARRKDFEENKLLPEARQVFGYMAKPLGGGASASPPMAPADELRHVKDAIKAGAPRDAARAEYIKRGGNAADFDREVPP